MFVPGVGTSSREDIVSYERGIRAGYFAVQSDHVQKVLGRPPNRSMKYSLPTKDWKPDET
jgi:hypothetical protein